MNVFCKKASLPWCGELAGRTTSWTAEVNTSGSKSSLSNSRVHWTVTAGLTLRTEHVKLSARWLFGVCTKQNEGSDGRTSHPVTIGNGSLGETK